MLTHNLASIFVFCTVLTLVLATYIAIREWVVGRGRIRTRLTAQNKKGMASEAELLGIRRSRSLTREGHYATPFFSLHSLILQSGTRFGLSGIVLAGLACCAAAYVITYFAGLSVYIQPLCAIACGIGLPLLVLRAMREGRLRLFEEQLPEAIDTIVRSLKAGHAIPSAISAVSGQLPDPIGTEFRMTAAEMSYGLDLETAMVNLHSRVGQPDLGLLSLAVAIQSKTGGNLAEVLTTMSSVIRGRLKLRRKARSLAAEARVSAYILTALPLLLFGVLWLIAPGYYGDVWNNSNAKIVLTGAVFWMIIGDYVMYRMARIRV
jgi:tight adherence protein B